METGLTIVLPSQLEKGESILIGSTYKHDQRRFW